MSLSVPVCVLVYVVNQVNQNGGGVRQVCEGTWLLPEEQGASYVFAAGAGRRGALKFRPEVRKDNKLPPQGPWGYESKAVLGGW